MRLGAEKDHQTPGKFREKNLKPRHVRVTFLNFTNKLESENVWILCHIYTHSKDNENIYITMLNEKK